MDECQGLAAPEGLSGHLDAESTIPFDHKTRKGVGSFILKNRLKNLKAENLYLYREG